MEPDALSEPARDTRSDESERITRSAMSGLPAVPLAGPQTQGSALQEPWLGKEAFWTKERNVTAAVAADLEIFGVQIFCKFKSLRTPSP